MSDYLFGFDIGTQSAKGMILDCSGNIIAEAVKPHEILRPHAGWAEHDPETNYWESFKELSKSMLDESGINASDIKAIGVDALVPTMMAVDDNDMALRNSILFIDNRAVKQLDEANAKLETKISLEKVVPKILWFKENEPDLYEKTKYFTLPHSYLVAKLTGKTMVDVDTANVYGEVFNVEKNDWDQGQCDLLGIDKKKLPPAGPMNQIVGKTNKRAAEAGLPEGIPVIVGTGDSYASLVGYGAVHKGDMMIYLGTAGTQIMCKRELFDVIDSIHISDTGRTVEWKANMIACGQGLEWLRTKIAGEGYTYDRLNEEAASLPIGSNKLITLPHYMGIRTPEPDAVAKGSLFGLGLTHTPVHMYRSLLEGLTFGMKQGMDAIKDPVNRIVVTGGGSNSDLWCQILSDALGRPVEVPESGGAAMGIAYIAGVSVGMFSDYTELEQGWIKLKKSMEPNEKNTEEYQEYYQIYLKLNEALASLYRPLYDL